MKIVVRIILPVVYGLAVLFSVVLIVKPGASIFLHRQDIPHAEMKPEGPFAYHFMLNLTSNFYQPENSMVFQDGRALNEAQPPEVLAGTPGTFTFQHSTEGKPLLYFTPFSPHGEGLTFRVYTPVKFITRSAGQLYLAVLLLGLALFLYFKLVPAGKRDLQALRRTASAALSAKVVAKRLFTLSMLAAISFVGMEWLFQATKSSFLQSLGLVAKVEILLITSLFLALPLLLVQLALFGFSRIQKLRVVQVLTALAPSFFLAGTVLLMVENFTRTVFKWGIVDADGWVLAGYVLIFLAVFIYINVRLLRLLYIKKSPALDGFSTIFALVWAGAALMMVGILFDPSSITTNPTAMSQSSRRLPNILLIGSDGVSADHLSMYGYGKDTSPNLVELAKASMVAENAFSNGNKTSGSVTSILNSKNPFATKVLYDNVILQGSDSLQHLPGLLKLLGYDNYQFAVPTYADADQMNMQFGFDEVNGRVHSPLERVLLSGLIRAGYGQPVYFLSATMDRLNSRLLHIFNIQKMQNAFEMVTEAAKSLDDRHKLEQMYAVLAKTNHPVFVHMHLMGTHGGQFDPATQVYSKGMKQTEQWMPEFYDDTVLNFDQYVGEIVKNLKDSGQWQNTVLMIYSDHSTRAPWAADTPRIPLLIHFPGDANARKIPTDVQNLDFAPTILDYLNQPIPKWMQGQSVLHQDPAPTRTLFAAGGDKDGVLPSVPPLYGFVELDAIQCNYRYRLDMLTGKLTTKPIPDHTAPCPAETVMTPEQARQTMLNYLKTNGFHLSFNP